MDDERRWRDKDGNFWFHPVGGGYFVQTGLGCYGNGHDMVSALRMAMDKEKEIYEGKIHTRPPSAR